MRGWRRFKEVDVTIYLNKEQRPYGTLRRMLLQHSHSPSYFVVQYHNSKHIAQYSPQKGWHVNV